MSRMKERYAVAMMELTRCRNECADKGYHFSHHAKSAGYYSVDEVEMFEFEGRRGKGYAIHYHASKANGSYHIVEYWFK